MSKIRRSSSFRPRLVVMVKLPAAGRVKSRLGRACGMIRAAVFYRHTVAAVLSRIACDARWETVLAVSPDSAVRHSFWPSRIPRTPQGRADLGRRMENLVIRCPPGPVVIVGTDIPAIRPNHVRQAFRLLGRADVVIGPALDGGYWLIGFARRSHARTTFRNVRWSSPHARADTLANLRGLKVGEVATLGDVDSAADLATVSRWYGRRILPWPVGHSSL